MADRVGPETRSRIMRSIRSRGTSPELALESAVREDPRASRFGRESHAALPGTPDMSFPRRKVAVFVDGCFWHGCPSHFSVPSTNPEFWAGKIRGNRARDRRVDRALRSAGWTVLRFWEHRVRKDPGACVTRILSALRAPRRTKITGGETGRREGK